MVVLGIPDFSGRMGPCNGHNDVPDAFSARKQIKIADNRVRFFLYMFYRNTDRHGIPKSPEPRLPPNLDEQIACHLSR